MVTANTDPHFIRPRLQRGRCLLLALLWCLGSLPLMAQTGDSLARRIILIGDAGELHQDGRNPVVDAVRQRFNLQDSRNIVLFLGDNVYPYGLPDEADRRYPQAQQILDYQVNLVRNTATRGIFIPGNHDWQKSKPGGWETIRNQQLYIDSLRLPNVAFLPKDGCPGPEEVPLDSNITLIIMDTEWWLFPYRKPGEQSACDCKTKDEVLTAVNDIVSRNRNKLIIFAAHHPFRSYGIHGGYYTIKQHIFPFTDLKPSLYIPLPVLGSVYPLVRGVFGTPEDIPNPQYQEMIKGVEETLQPHGPAVFVSGHDHTLQLINDPPNYYVVSGSGAKDNRVKKGRRSLFASRENGFTALEVLRDGTVRARYYTAADTAGPVYAARLFNIQDIRSRAETGTPAARLPPVVTLAADTQYNNAGSFHRWLLGNNYRQLWATPLPFPVMDLKQRELKILKRGGGKQTRSLRLEDSTGQEWVLRSLKKYTTAALPEELRQTAIAREIVQDQISASNPYAPLAVASLAEATGVPHTNPRFVYLPKDTSLGIYEKDFGDGVYLFEEREPNVKGKTYNTEKLLEQVLGDNDNVVDEQAVLKARLLDILIADWDRHDDQWRWGVQKNKKNNTQVFYPIPRDRDQAFFMNEGVIPRIASKPYLLPRIQGFRKKIPYIYGLATTAQPFDRSFMNGLDREQWQRQARRFVQDMSDSVLQQAVNQFPGTVRAQVGDFTLSTLKARRNILEDEAMKFYRFLSREVDVPGTKKTELFTVERLPQGRLSVNVHKVSKKGKLEQSIYRRTFDPADTREVRLYGLGGNDRFEIKGDARSPILLRIIGGRDADTYVDSSTQRAGKRIRIYDLAQGKDTFLLNGHEKRLLSSNPSVIAYDRKAFKYNILMPLVTAGFNRDDGVLLGLGFQYTGQAFRKEPFAVKHTFTAGHALATQAWQFRYQGEFTDVIGKTDLLLLASARAPHNTINFFGYGNETVFDKSNDRTISYYRTRFNLYNFEGLLKTPLSPRVQLGYGPTFTYYALDKDENNGRYISNFPHNGLDSAGVYEDKTYAGARLALQIDTRNNRLLPTRGLYWTTSLHGNQGLNEDHRHYLQLQTDMSIYTSFNIPANFVFVTRFGGGVTWGHYEYFQALTLGGTQNLRGYRNYRFAGKGMVYNNTEIRLKLFEFSSYLFPATVGLIAFNDVGRVWQKGETSHVWHDGYGGGLFFSPINMLVITATVGHSSEETLPYVTFGFKF